MGSNPGFPAIGKDGKDGVDGITPQIGHNGNWWIDGQGPRCTCNWQGRKTV